MINKGDQGNSEKFREFREKSKNKKIKNKNKNKYRKTISGPRWTCVQNLGQIAVQPFYRDDETYRNTYRDYNFIDIDSYRV